MQDRSVYLFQQGNAGLKDLLGGKGANLAEMCRLGLPVPPGFTITTQMCMAYLENGPQLSSSLLEEIQKALHVLEQAVGKRFGDPGNPLLLSIRSGAKFSMPGMMETILNLGLNDQTLAGLIGQTNNERFAYDSYRRLIGMFSSVVFNINKDEFEKLLQEKKAESGVTLDTDLGKEALEDLVNAYKNLVKTTIGRSFPQDPLEQLTLAIEAVFQSWNKPRAVTYRNYHQIDHRLGTAVNVQTMVFGNMGNDSATGVAFSRDPISGESRIFGEYLINAQGEDVVSGIRTPHKLMEMEQALPDAYQQLVAFAQQLEAHYKDIQDIEFTLENGHLYLLQTRIAKRTIQAAIKIAVDMANEGLITQEEALLRVDANQLYKMLAPYFDPEGISAAHREGYYLGSGVNASPGAATGILAFNPDEAERRGKQGENIILARVETNPDDIHGIIAAQGVLTGRGGNTSHAAVVARGMGKPCVVGCAACTIDLKTETLMINGKTLKKGDVISIDGSSGEIFSGEIARIPPQLSGDFNTLLSWADQVRRLDVLANADTPEDAEKAREWGAHGIGLCRTEHMFMARDRLSVVREMIMAASPEERQNALDKLLPMQLEDFKGIFTAMAGYPIIIRLLDPPLHEFLPNHDELMEEVLRLWCKGETGPDLNAKEAFLKKVTELRESNPMMGFRGCRIGLIYPEIYDMQVEAILKAAILTQKQGVSVTPEIMIPLVSEANELRILRERLTGIARTVFRREQAEVPFRFGTMIETPRAALTLNEIARHADFFSFGTNDLTQMTFGFSRDDAEGKFLKRYLEQGILADNPFETLDQQGVGRLIQTAKDLAESVRPGIPLGLCGEHGGDPRSIHFCHQAGLSYVSCSPYRIPTARLAAAQAAVMERPGFQEKSQEKILSTA